MEKESYVTEKLTTLFIRIFDFSSYEREDQKLIMTNVEKAIKNLDIYKTLENTYLINLYVFDAQGRFSLHFYNEDAMSERPLEIIIALEEEIKKMPIQFCISAAIDFAIIDKSKSTVEQNKEKTSLNEHTQRLLEIADKNQILISSRYFENAVQKVNSQYKQYFKNVYDFQLISGERFFSFYNFYKEGSFGNPEAPDLSKVANTVFKLTFLLVVAITNSKQYDDDDKYLKVVNGLKKLIKSTTIYSHYARENVVTIKNSTDGYQIIFSGDTSEDSEFFFAPIKLISELHEKKNELDDELGFEVQFHSSIHGGLTREVPGGEESNLPGGNCIDTAEEIRKLGKGEQILISEDYYKFVLGSENKYKRNCHPIGRFKIDPQKDTWMLIYNFYNESGIGDPNSKLKKDPIKFSDISIQEVGYFLHQTHNEGIPSLNEILPKVKANMKLLTITGEKFFADDERSALIENALKQRGVNFKLLILDKSSPMRKIKEAFDNQQYSTVFERVDDRLERFKKQEYPIEIRKYTFFPPFEIFIVDDKVMYVAYPLPYPNHIYLKSPCLEIRNEISKNNLFKKYSEAFKFFWKLAENKKNSG